MIFLGARGRILWFGYGASSQKAHILKVLSPSGSTILEVLELVQWGHVHGRCILPWAPLSPSDSGLIQVSLLFMGENGS
jgi:hypothetical protein